MHHLNRPNRSMSDSPRTPAAGRRLSGEDRAGAVARTYARGSRRLQLTESQLRYIARQEQGGPAPTR